MSDRLRVVLVGASGVGGQRHQAEMYAPAFLAHPGFDVIGIVDHEGAGPEERETTARLASTRGLTVLESMEGALSAADVASLCLPYEHRADVVSLAAEAGVAMVVDKPLALSAEDALRLHELVAAFPVVAMPAHHVRFHPSVRAAVAAVTRGDIGLPWAVQAEYVAVGDRMWPHGELANLLCYPLDVARAILALDPRAVAAWRSSPFYGESDGSGEDIAVLSLLFDRDIPVSITVGRSTAPGHSSRSGGDHRYRIMGSEGVLDVNLALPSVSIRSAADTPGLDSRGYGKGSLRAFLDHLAVAVPGQVPPDLTFADAVVVAETVDAARSSADTARTVALDRKDQ